MAAVATFFGEVVATVAPVVVIVTATINGQAMQQTTTVTFT